MDGKWGKVGGRLELLATHEIRGSNPTKLHHTNKSQKNWGYFCGAIFEFGTKSTKLGLKTKRGGSES